MSTVATRRETRLDGVVVVPAIVLAGATLLLRGVGLAIPALASWQTDVRIGLTLMFLVTASAHFTPMRRDLVAMVPRGCRCGRRR